MIVIFIIMIVIFIIMIMMIIISYYYLLFIIVIIIFIIIVVIFNEYNYSYFYSSDTQNLTDTQVRLAAIGATLASPRDLVLRGTPRGPVPRSFRLVELHGAGDWMVKQ